jgi:hypothetical protein
MALSGSYYTNVGSHWRLQLEWTATQSVAGNYSDVTAKLYWMALDGYGAVYSSAAKDGGIYIQDTWNYFTGETAALSGNQKRLLHTFTKRLYHNSNGTFTMNLDGFFDAEVTLGGTYYGRINLATKYFTLNTIPRASSLTSSPSWTAGNSLPISINRADSGFTHDVTVSVNGVVIRKLENIATSYTIGFTQAELTSIFNQLNGAASENTLVRVETFDGSTLIGTEDYTGTVTAPPASVVASGFDRYVYTDQTINADIDRAHSGFTHTLKYFVNGVLIKTITGVTTSYAWTPTQAEMDAMHAQMSTVTYIDGNLEITTYYNGEVVRSPSNNDLDFYIRNANPLFDSGDFSYLDRNTTTSGLTGNNQYIVQGESLPRVTISSAAQGQKGASIVSYIVSLAGQEDTLAAIGTTDFNEIDASSNQTLSIKVVDSRGNYTTITKTVTVVPYKPPVLNGSAARQNDFESDTVLGVETGSSYSRLLVGGVQKNVLSLVQYRYKEKSSSTWSNWTSFPGVTTANGVITASDVLVTLTNTVAWDVEFRAIDSLSTTVIALSVGTGEPLYFIDVDKKSVGVNKLPSTSEGFEFNGKNYFLNTQTLPSILDISGSYGATVWYRKIADLPATTSGTFDYLVVELYGGGWNAGDRYYYKCVFSNRDSLNWTFHKETQDAPPYDRTNIVVIGNSVYVKYTSYVSGFITANIVGGGVANKGSVVFGPPTSVVPTGTLLFDTQTAEPSGILHIDRLFAEHEALFKRDVRIDGNILDQLGNVYDFYAGRLVINGQKVADDRIGNQLWAGGSFMSSTQTVYPSVPIDQCPNGWILVWSDYTAGSGSENFDWAFTFVPKEIVALHPGTLTYHPIPNYVNATTVEVTAKELYFANDRISGSGDNDLDSGTNNNADVVLRYVLMW